MIVAGRIETRSWIQSLHNLKFCGLDMPFATTAQGYSTTEFE